MGTAQDRGRFDCGSGCRGRLGIPPMCLQAAQNAVGEPNRSQGVFATDPGARQSPRGLDEVFELESERLPTVGLDAVDSQHLAEKVLSHDRRLGQIDPFEVEPTPFELFGRANQGCLLRREVE